MFLHTQTNNFTFRHQNSPTPLLSLTTTISQPTMLIPPPPLHHHPHTMLLTIVSVFLFVLFITILHLYARWFFSQVHPRTQTTVTLTQISRPPRLHRRSTAMFGLPSPIIASLPLFVHSSLPPGDSNCVLECAICLSAFQEEEIGRKLPVCGHAFHVECIDMWLHSHSTCPICRAAILWSNRRKLENVNRIVDREHVEIDVVDPELLEVEDAIRLPVQESPKTPNTSVEINSGPSSSSS